MASNTTLPCDDIWFNFPDEKTGMYLLSENQLTVLKQVLIYCFQMPVLALGIGTNMATIITFLVSGVKDSITLSCLALGLSDWGYATFFFISRFISFLNSIVGVQSYVSLGSLAVILSYVSLVFQDISTMITIYIALQKCCAVALPHLFKHFFTLRRALVVITFICIAILAIYVPMISSMRLEPSFSRAVNGTQLLFVFYPLGLRMLTFFRTFNRIMLPMSAQAIVTTCLVVMIFRLKQSAKFRGALTDQLQTTTTMTKAENSYSSGKLNSRERRALAAVTVICSLFVIATTPTILWYCLQFIFPFVEDADFKPVRAVIENCENILVHINATVNFFVYLKFNSKFKETFAALSGYRSDRG